MKRRKTEDLKDDIIFAACDMEKWHARWLLVESKITSKTSSDRLTQLTPKRRLCSAKFVSARVLLFDLVKQLKERDEHYV